MKIDIVIDNNRKFADVAFLVDRDDFLRDIEDVRRRIKLSSIPYTFPNYSYKEANRLAGFYKKGQISVNGAREMLEHFCAEIGLLNLYALDKTLGAAVIFAKSLTKKYKKNRLYIPIIVASILVAHIQEEDFRSTQVFEINRKVLKEELKELQKDEKIITISVSRESTPEEVGDRFDHIKKYIFKTKPTKDSDGLSRVYNNEPYNKLLDTANNIKRDREWYWMYQEEKANGKGIYKRIVEKWDKRHPSKDPNNPIDQNTIEQAVSHYKKLLKTVI